MASPVKKHRQGKPLKNGGKEIVLYTFNPHLEKQPTLIIIQVSEMTSKYIGVSASSILHAWKEKQNTVKLRTLEKKRI